TTCISFFFQAEDGIRDKLVTGVQTCALPIFGIELGLDPQALVALLGVEYPPDVGLRVVAHVRPDDRDRVTLGGPVVQGGLKRPRSEERRVGKERRSWWSSAR